MKTVLKVISNVAIPVNQSLTIGVVMINVSAEQLSAKDCAPLDTSHVEQRIVSRILHTIKIHIGLSVCNLNTKEHKSKSAAITQTGNRVQDLAGVRNETKSSESKFGKAQVSIC